MFRTWWRSLNRRRSFSPRGGKRSPPRRRRPWLYVEPLEERILLSGQSALPPSLVVGRTLSSYFVGGVQNKQETITYTVYNEQAHPITGVLLTDTLEPGVTVASASPLPDQSGQNLAWSLGTIQGFDRASVTLTVNLATPIPLQLDMGAQAFATLNAGAVSNTTPAAVLRPGNVSDPSLLASTPDANTTDPFIQEQAAKLNYDPQQIFAFLHNDIGYNSYLGSLRGARGTLWSSAGNALDVASLGVALMRASGIPAQYEQGTLSQAQAQQLILSMFPASYQTVGNIPAGTQTADPANDPQLLAETESHYWFQFDAGQGMHDADPLMAAAQVGQAFASATGAFTEVPDSLRAKTEVKLTAEIYNQASALFGVAGGLSDSVALDQTFDDVNLVGRPLSIGNFVSSQGGGFIFTSVTNTYAPYINLGDEAYPDGSQDQIIRGSDYQETLTNFPLGSQVLTGVFLNITTVEPEGPGQPQTNSVEKTLFDRIGFAARQGNSPVSVQANSVAPALSDQDIVTLQVSASGESLAALSGRSNALTKLTQQLTSQRSLLAQGNQASQIAAVDRISLLERSITYQASSILAKAFANESDGLAANINSLFLTESYFVSPRIVAVSGTLSTGVALDTGTLNKEFDILQDSLRVVASPAQTLSAEREARIARGNVDSIVEGMVLNNGQPAQSLSSFQVFSAALSDGTSLVVIDSTRLTSLDTLPLSPQTKARITRAVLSGSTVFVPTEMVQINGQSTIAWIEADLATGQLIYVSEDGSHDAIVEYAGLQVTVPEEVLAGEASSAEAAEAGAQQAESVLQQLLAKGKDIRDIKKLVGGTRGALPRLFPTHLAT